MMKKALAKTDDQATTPSPRDYEAFFDRVAEITRHLQHNDPLDDLEAMRRLLEDAGAALPIGRSADGSLDLNDVIASSSLSGGDNPCSWIDCRVKNAESGARFAALYAERVWIRDPFESVSHHAVDDLEYVNEALAAVSSMLQWKPLLLAGVAAHLAPICSTCAAKRIADDKLLNTPVQDLGVELLDEIARAGKATVTRDEFGEINVELDLPAKYLGHRHTVARPSGASAKRLAAFLGKRTSRKVPKTGRLVVDAFANVWRPTLDEALHQAMHRGLSGATYVSNLPIDLELAARTAADQAEVKNAARLVGALKHTVPIVENVPISTVLQLRQEDKGSFHLYRKRVAALRAELHDERRLREAAEELRSEFTALETQIAARKTSLWGGVRDQVKIATGTVGTGIGAWLFGILTPTVSGLIAAAGGLSLVHRVAGDVLSARRSPPQELTHPLYFLWRVKKTARRTL